MDPGGQGRLGLEVAQGLHDADEGLLEQVLGDVRFADEAEDETDEGFLQPLDELPVGGRVAAGAFPE